MSMKLDQALTAMEICNGSPTAFVDIESPVQVVPPSIAKASPVPKISSRIGTLNGLRGLACLSIIFCHSFMAKAVTFDKAPKLATPFGLFPAYAWPLAWLSNASTGVDLFFVLSGFVLYLPYCTGSRIFNTIAQDSPSFGSRFSFKTLLKSCLQFYKRRCERLLPLYFFSLAVFVLFWISSDPYTPQNPLKPSTPKTAKDFDILSGPILGELAVDMTMIFIFVPGCFIPTFNHPYWTIAYEFWFSILFPVFVLVFLFVRERGGIRGSAIGTAVFMAIWYFIRVATLIYTDQDHNTPIIGSYFDEFAMGMLACEFYVYVMKEKQGKTSALSWFLGGIGLITIAFNGADSTRLSLSLKNNGEERPDSLVFMTNPYVRAFLNIFMTSGYTMLVIGAAFLKKDVESEPESPFISAPRRYLNNTRRWLSKVCYWILANALSQILGIMCFSIYIWHYHIYERFFTAATPDEFRGLYFVVYLAVTGLFAAASCSYIEFPKLTNKQIFVDTISE